MIHDLTSSVTIAITFSAPPRTNANLAVIYRLDASGDAQLLATTVNLNPDGTFTASASVSHLSSFELFAPPSGVPIPMAYVPVAEDGAAVAATG